MHANNNSDNKAYIEKSIACSIQLWRFSEGDGFKKSRGYKQLSEDTCFLKNKKLIWKIITRF